MKRFLSLLVASAFLAGGVVAQNGLESKPSANGFVQVPPSAPLSAPAGKFSCAKPSFDFGEVSQGEELSHDYPVENVGKSDLEIVSVHGSCGCTHAAAEKTRLAPGEKTVINAKLNTTGKQGPTQITITVTTNDTSSPTSSLTLTGRVAQPVRPSVTELNFGTLRKGTAVAPKTFEVLISGAQSITDAKTDHEQVKVEYTPLAAEDKKQGYKLTVSLDGLLPVGQLRSNISLTTTVPAQKTVTIPVLALVEGEIAVKPRTLSLGTVKAGETPTKVVEIEKAGNPDLKIESLQVKPEGAFTAKLEEVKAGQTYKVVIGIAPDAKKGYSRGTVSIKTNVPGETDLQVYFYALLN